LIKYQHILAQTCRLKYKHLTDIASPLMEYVGRLYYKLKTDGS